MIKFFFPFLLLLTFFSISLQAVAQNVTIPLMFEKDPNIDFRIQFNREHLASIFHWKKKTFSLPKRHLAIQVIPIDDNNRLIIARTVYQGDARLFMVNRLQNIVKSITLPVALQNRLPIHGFKFNKHFALVLYDRKKRSSSLYVWQLKNSMLQPEDMTGSPLTFGGLYEINIPLYDQEKKDGFMLCGGQSCYEYHIALKNKPARIHKTHIANAVQMIEFAHHKQGGSYGLFIKMVDDRLKKIPDAKDAVYFLAKLPNGKLKPLDPYKIPMRLNVDAKGATLKFAKTTAEYSEMFIHDLQALSLSSAMIFGMDNREGRVSWVQHYYLNGLIDIVATKMESNHTLFRFAEPYKKQLKQRLKLEIEHIDRLLSSEPQWLLTQRYSLSRQTLLSAVHVGRAIKTLIRYQRYVAPNFKSQSLARLKEALFNTKDRMDRLVIHDKGKETFIKIKKGVPFLHDGLNVPHNVQNGWAEGVVMAFGNNQNSKKIDIAYSILANFLKIEKIQSKLTKDYKWYYWWGKGYQGYKKEEKLSLNTLSYKGYKEIAHISYRSMDVMAILRMDAERTGLLTLSNKLYFCQSLEQGNLYPFVSREFGLHGLTPKIPFHIARLYARISSAWEIENTVWALESLTNPSKTKCQ